LAARLTCYTKVLSKNMKKIATVIENENFIKQLLLNYSTRYSGYELIATYNISATCPVGYLSRHVQWALLE